jgi:hypothetical protein
MAPEERWRRRSDHPRYHGGAAATPTNVAWERYPRATDGTTKFDPAEKDRQAGPGQVRPVAEGQAVGLTRSGHERAVGDRNNPPDPRAPARLPGRRHVVRVSLQGAFAPRTGGGYGGGDGAPGVERRPAQRLRRGGRPPVPGSAGGRRSGLHGHEARGVPGSTSQGGPAPGRAAFHRGDPAPAPVQARVLGGRRKPPTLAVTTRKDRVSWMCVLTACPMEGGSTPSGTEKQAATGHVEGRARQDGERDGGALESLLGSLGARETGWEKGSSEWRTGSPGKTWSVRWAATSARWPLATNSGPKTCATLPVRAGQVHGPERPGGNRTPRESRISLKRGRAETTRFPVPRSGWSEETRGRRGGMGGSGCPQPDSSDSGLPRRITRLRHFAFGARTPW